jgi:hypothetical protein
MELLIAVAVVIGVDVLALFRGSDSRDGWSPALAARRADIERLSR